MALTVLGACGAGVAGFLAGGFEFRGRARFSVPGPAASAESLNTLRHELDDYVQQTLGDTSLDWRVEWDEGGRGLDLNLYGQHVEEVRKRVNAVADGFPTYLRAREDAAKSTPGPAERLLLDRRETIERQAAELRSDSVRLASNAALDGCDQAQGDWRDRLKSRRIEFDALREQVSALESELAGLRENPNEADVVVDPDVREQAIVADVELQQDLKALRLHFAETRGLLLRTWQEGSPALAELIAAAEELATVASGDEARAAEGAPQEAVDGIAQAIDEYQALLSTIEAAWHEEFKLLGELSDDPRRGDVLTVQQRLGDQLNAFLFQSGPPLTVLRDGVKAVSDDSASQPRQHALASALTRSFHAFQTAHHRFEFIAADAKPSQNFRLDAALRAAQGLWRRSQERLRGLEGELAVQALADLRAARERRKTELEATLVDARARLHSAMDALVAIHDQAEQARPELERCIRAAAVRELDARRLREFEAELSGIDTRVRELAAARLHALPAERVDVAYRAVERKPVNLAPKLLQGGLCALVGLLVLSAALLRNPRE